MRRQNLEPLYDWVTGVAGGVTIPGSLARTLGACAKMSKCATTPLISIHQQSQAGNGISYCASKAQQTTEGHRATAILLRLFCDRGTSSLAYLSYAYIRWCDDMIDTSQLDSKQKWNFIQRQRRFLDGFYEGNLLPAEALTEEEYLYHIVQSDLQNQQRLRSYLTDLLLALAFDAKRSAVPAYQPSRVETDLYVERIGRGAMGLAHSILFPIEPYPFLEKSFLGEGIEIIHMLRDFRQDLASGIVNISQEEITQHSVSLNEINSPGFRQWVLQRAQTALSYIDCGRQQLIKHTLRCRIAWYLYSARYEWLAHRIVQDGGNLRVVYDKTFWQSFLLISFLLIGIVRLVARCGARLFWQKMRKNLRE